MEIKMPAVPSQGMGAPGSAPSAVSTAPDVDPVDAWMTEHPTFDPSKDAVETPGVPPDLDTSEAPAPKTEARVDEATPTESDAAKPGEAPAKADGTPPKVEAKKPDDKPADKVETKPETKTYASDEKIALAEGVEWTRAQVIAGLNERRSLRENADALKATADEGKVYKDIFGLSAAEAKENWVPILQATQRNPNAPKFLSDYLFGDPAKVQWLENAAAHYDSEIAKNGGAPAPAAGAPAPARQPAAIDPELKKQVDELMAFKQRREMEDTRARVQSELDQVIARYPILGTDHKLRQDLLMTAKYVNSQDPNKGILDVVNDRASMYQMLQSAAASQPATPPKTDVPALIGGQGASPTGAQPADPVKSKDFGSLDDAVDDWINNPPKKFAS